MSSNISKKIKKKAHREICGPLRKVRGRIRVPENIKPYMTEPVDFFNFEFDDPTDVLIRLLLFSPLAADPCNLCFRPEVRRYYEDFCDGSRMHRVEADLPKGTIALGCILFFDEVNRDEKGFATGDGGVVVGGFFRKHVRESTHAKAHFATFLKPGFKKGDRCVMKFFADLCIYA